jgi:membrane protein
MADGGSGWKTWLARIRSSTTWGLLQETITRWQEDKASRLAAALSYYTIFSLPPLLLIIIAVAGFFLGRSAVRQQIVGQISSVMGDQGAQAIQVMLDNAGWSQGAGILATVIGVVTLLMGATGAFVQLQDALDTIWDVAPRPGGPILSTVKDRLLSFSMVLVIAFLLLVSLLVSAALSALGSYLQSMLPETLWLARLLSFVLSFGLITLLFALIYKYLPDAEIAWGDVWPGAAVTALLFVIGKFVLGLYLGSSSAASAYGVAGSLVLILLWIYYSSQILFLGAEFTQVYARRLGSRIVPAEDAVRLTARDRARQGIPRQEAVTAAVSAEERRELTAIPPVPGLAPTPRPRQEQVYRSVYRWLALAASAVAAGLALLLFQRKGA